ncbi:calsyntenin-1-like protein, partial [Euroglyphus maynei]
PRFDLNKPEDGFHAIVKENDRTVIISPRIKVVDAELCNIEIVNKHHNDIPFEVQITDQLNGEAIITAKRDLNCEKKRSYHFTMRAVSTTVHVTVEDVNEFAPVFRQDSYVVTVNEGRIIDPIIQVEAIDHDCSLKYSEICKYEIIGGDKLNTPFTIDSNGNIKNTRALYYKESHNHILEIVAYDCGMKRSKPAIVNIKINKVCTLGWKGIPERMEYIPGSGSRVLIPDAELQLCDFPCETENVTVRMTLATHHIGKGCDRDTYSVESQRKLCGATVESIDLLPSSTTGSEWIRDLPTDEGRESDQIYEFDGANNAVIVPENVFDHNLTSKFTISFWMKHEPPLDQSNKHIKEHIICNADDHKIVDDWPLHAVKDVKTTFSVGACWEGKKSKMNFYFRGFLAGLTLLRGQTENSDIFKCLHHCKEGLRQPSSDSIDSGIDILSSGDSTSIMVMGKESIDVEDVVSQISYINSREYPTPGRRSLKLSTWVTCSNGKKLKVPQVDTYVMVMPADPPTIMINGTPNLAREYESFMQGIDLFSTVSIYINQENENDNNESDNDIEENNDDDEMNNVPPSIAKLIGEHKLDSCSIKVYPPLNPDHEYFRLPIQMMQHLNVRDRETKDGIIIYGADSVHNYNQIIRQLIYFNRKPAYYLNRAFKLTCSELNRRFSSNDYIQTLTVIHPKIEPIETRPQSSGIGGGVQTFAAHAHTSEQKVELKEPLIKSTAHFFDNSISVDPNDSFVRATPRFLVFMIVLGVIRIRSAHHRNNDSTTEDQEMAWDDNSLNITVNPLDQIEQEHENPQLNDDEDESDSSDDASSYHEDCETSEEEVDKTNKSRSELEWDDANF